MESSVRTFPSPSTQRSEGMAPFTLPAAFKSVGCMTDGRLTPPLSPTGTSPSTMKSPSSARLHFAKLLSRCPRLAKSTRQIHQGELLCQHSGASVTRSMLSRPAVTHMMAPFPLILPESPVSAERDGSDRHSFRLPYSELRRVSSSYQDLRAIAQEQENCLNVPPFSHPQTPLLPSPIIDDRKMKTTLPPHSNFMAEHHQKNFVQQRQDSTYKSYDDLQILSCYEDAIGFSKDDLNDTSLADAVYVRPDEYSPYTENLGSSPMSQQSSTSSNSSIDSSESGWLANTTSHDERQRRFKARCYQVVQHPYRSKQPSYDTEDKIMLATVLVGPGKPKLVQIQRPASSNTSMRSKESLVITQNLQKSAIDIPGLPSTPAKQRKEISAFSPYDTPSNFEPYTNTSCNVPRESKSTIHEPIYSASKLDLMPMPLKTSRHTSSESAKTASSVYSGPTKHQLDPFHSPTTRSYNNSTIPKNMAKSNRFGEVRFRKPLHKSPAISAANQSRHRKLDRTITAITRAIEAFPNDVLRLDSPEILELRPHSSPQIDEKILETFNTVFPKAPRLLLSALVAWLTVDTFFSSLADEASDKSKRSDTDIYVKNDDDTRSHNSRSLSRSNSTSEHRRPLSSLSLSMSISSRSFSRSSSRLTRPRQLPRPTPIMVPSLPVQYSQHYPQVTLRDRANDHVYHHDNHNGIGTHSTAPCSPTTSNRSFNSIPPKACSILGIDVDDMNEKLLHTRARALQISISIIAQKLLEVVKGEDGWDAPLWKALRLMMKMVEEMSTRADHDSSERKSHTRRDAPNKSRRTNDAVYASSRRPSDSTDEITIYSLERARDTSETEKRLGVNGDFLGGIGTLRNMEMEEQEQTWF